MTSAYTMMSLVVSLVAAGLILYGLLQTPQQTAYTSLGTFGVGVAVVIFAWGKA